MKKTTRRVFLRSGGLALISLGAAPSFMIRTVAAAARSGGAGRRVLVCVFQRGAVDGLNVVVPHGEEAYYRGRPSIAIGRPARADRTAALDLDGFFGFHPSLGSLKSLWDEKRVAVLHAAGSPDSTRSHFDAQDYMETATPGRRGTPDGWLNRVLRATSAGRGAGSFRGVALAGSMPLSLQGPAPALSMPDLERFRIRAGRAGSLMEDSYTALYGTTRDRILGRTGRETLSAAATLEALDPERYRPARGVEYPAGPFGRSMREIAQLVKADVGLEIAFTESGGWDHHANEGNHQGPLANLLREFSDGLAAFAHDLGDRSRDVLVLTMSEFGRRVAENGTRGTDHGHANVMFLVGGDVEGGRVHGDWPGLAPEKLYDGRDLALTTDFRDVFAEVAARHLGVRSLGPIFPGYRPDPSRFRGLLRTRNS